MSTIRDMTGSVVFPATKFERKSWPEDFGHENGNYECVCSVCNGHFYGHKRRVICRECAEVDQ